MSLLLNCRALKKSFGSRTIFENVSLTISEGDRLGLIGPNGSGKSTLLRILAGVEEADSGDRSLRKATRLCYVPQDSVFAPGATVRQVLEAACPPGEDFDARLNTTLGTAGFTTGAVDPEQPATRLSGGWRKRLAIAEALIQSPDILLLDEPTNHLDLAGILWLERLLGAARFAAVIVSHDRYFLENAVTAMAELNRVYPGGLFRTPGSYSEFLEKRAAFLDAQAKLEDSLRNKVRREVEWLRRGAKARTTKSKARIGEANRLMDELAVVSDRRRTATAQIDFSATERKTRKLIETRNVACDVGGRRLISGLNLTLSPGACLALVGANGTGKTSLLRLLLGEIPPAEGEVFRAENLRMVYFDQNREQLDPDVSLRRALAPHGDSVIYNGRVIHVAGWAKRFLFRDDQLDLKVERLSGGERARVLLARLMLREADVLLLDEPTNDLDIPTLEVLEESLLEFPGAIVLVTHDRYLVDSTATAVLGFDGSGSATLFATYAQCEAAMEAAAGAAPAQKSTTPAPAARPESAPAGRKKLSYLEAREWERIEQAIAEAESLFEEKQRLLEAPDVVRDGERLRQVYAEMETARGNVDRLYERWAELEAKQSA